MERSQPAGGMLNPFSAKRTPVLSDDALSWMGGEASVGTPARHYLRRQERHTAGLVFTVLGLTFLGGLAAGSLVNSLLRQSRR